MDKEHVEEGMMSVLLKTDIQTLILRLPASYCGSYSLLEAPPGIMAKTIALSGGRSATLAGKVDPLSRMPEINARGNTEESVLTLDKTPALSGWNGGSHTGQLPTSMRIVAGKSRQVRFYIPDIDIPWLLGLVVLPDSEAWLDRLGVCAAIDAAINSRRIMPVAVLGIDNINGHEYIEILGGCSKLIKDIAGHLLPMIRAEQPQRQWADRSRTVLAGQSLNGVSALMEIRYASETFDLVLSHSPSMWQTPERTSRPNLFSETDISRVSKHLPSAPPQSVRISLYVGLLEGSTVFRVQQLHQRLIITGVESHYAIYTGGHDYAWWRGALVGGIGLPQD